MTVRGVTSVVAGQLTVQDLVLFEGPTLTGVLRDPQGKLLVGMRVSAHSTSGDVRRREKSDDQGRYRIKNLYPGRYTVRVGGARRGAGSPLLEVEVVSGRLERDLLVPTGAKISGVVVDAQGKPVKDANLFAVVGRDYRGNGRSDKAGRFEIKDLPPGDYLLYVRVGDDRLVGVLPISLHEGATLDDLSLLVREPAQLSGRVLGPQGQPLAGVVIEVRGGESPVQRRAETKADGTFTIGPLYDGEYELNSREGPLTLLAAKWQVARVTIESFRFVVSEGQGLQRDLRVRVEQ